jgi:MFS family permease
MAESGEKQLRWYQGLSKYHWCVLVIGVMSWMFDCMDQRLFVLSRAPAVKELVGWPEREKALRPELQNVATEATQKAIDAGTLPEADRDKEISRRVQAGLDAEYKAEFKNKADSFGDIVTALMIVGWSVGGFLFGIYGDRLGRVKTLALAIGVYSLFTGLSGLSVSLWDFCLWRFLMGCGIGGAFATAATLIAETMPSHARATALGLFQALSAIGNISGSFIARYLVSASGEYDLFGLMPVDQLVSGWRILFMIGVLPAILVVFIMRFIKEPDAWQEARKTADSNMDRQLGDIKDMFMTARWRRNLLVGVSLAVVGVIGLWGVGFYSPELIGEALQDLQHKESFQAKYPNAAELPAEELQALVDKEKDEIKAMGTLLQDVGALLGMLVFTYIATRMGRRIAFGGAFLFCWVVVTGIFLFVSEVWHVYLLYPLLGFATLSVFGGYSIYFPELFPARLRASGTGFCYNVGRVFAAIVIVAKIPIREALTNAGFTEVFRTVSVVLASVYLFGLVILIWAPETKGMPLPTDDDE